MGDKRVRGFRRWRERAAAATMPAVAEPQPEPVTTGPVLAVPLPQRERVAVGERAVRAEGSDVSDIAAMMDFLRRQD